MGRFATTASLYEQLRPPYPAMFFQNVAETLRLSKQHCLIDLGTGPGPLALGFAPYVGRVVGVDPEPAMLTAAREAAARAQLALSLIESKAEDLRNDIGRFDIVTIGRALHWMDRVPTLRMLERVLAPGGLILICASFSVTDGRNAWLDTYNAARRSWAEESHETADDRAARIHRDLGGFLDRSPFRLVDVIATESTHSVSVHDLAQRVLTYSSSSTAVLGDKVEAMLRSVATKLEPFAQNGILTEVLVSVAQVVRLSPSSCSERF